MSTDQLLQAVLKKVPDADPCTILDLIVSCDANVSKVLELLGVEAASTQRQRQSTFKVAKPEKVVKPKTLSVVNLHTPEQVANAGVYCSLHWNVLDESLANRLAMQLKDDSQYWSHRKFHLFEREVTAPHATATYTDDAKLLDGTATATYQGSTVKSIWPFSSEMSTARDIVQEAVRKAGHRPNWNCNIVACNSYSDRLENLSYHSDQLTNLGPEPIIAALSLGCTREFRLQHRKRLKSDPIYFSLKLPHNSLLIMYGKCQERFKHCVPPAKSLIPHPLLDTTRLSLTFRCYLHEFATENIPKCRCGSSMILRTTLARDDNYRYIWQCGTHYRGETSCNQVIEASFQPPIDHSKKIYCNRPN